MSALSALVLSVLTLPALAREAPPLEAPGGVELNDTLEVHAWAGGGYTYTGENVRQHVTMGPFISMARFGGRISYEHYGDVFAQIDAADGTARLLDARVTIEPAPWFKLRAGRFKTSTSAEYLIPAPLMPFVNRALLVDWTPKRKVGVEAVVSPLDDRHLDLQVGIFNVGELEAQEGDGELLVTRLRWEPVHDLQFHLSWTDHLANTATAHHDPELHFTHDQLIDAAVEWDHNGWSAHLESLVRLDGGARGPGMSSFASVGHRFHRPGETVELEPVLGVDHVTELERQADLMALGLNVYVQEHHLVTMLNAEAQRLPDGSTHQAIYAQLRGGI